MYSNPYAYKQPEPQQYQQPGAVGRTAPVDPSVYQEQHPQQKSNISAAGVANGVMGAASLAADTIGMANEKLNLNTNIAPVQNDPSQAPIYTGGQNFIDAANARPRGASGGEILKSAGAGAAAGVGFGGIGAIVGAVVGAGAALIGGGARKRRQRREKQRAFNAALGAQRTFNTADLAYRQIQATMEDYYDNQNDNSRQYNVFRSQYQ